MFGFYASERLAVLKSRFRVNKHARRMKEIFFAFSRTWNSPSKVLAKKLISANIESVLDIGANVGQFAIDMRRNGYQNAIYSFEPVAQTFAVLTENSAQDDNWHALNVAVGESEGNAQINVSNNSGLSSSFLEMEPIHLNNFPNSISISSESVLLTTVDIQTAALEIEPKTSILKIDTQGYEYHVLKGAAYSLGEFKYCYLEVSLVQLYKGEKTFFDILDLLQKSNHELIEIFPGVRAKDGSLLQVDILTQSKNYRD